MDALPLPDGFGDLAGVVFDFLFGVGDLAGDFVDAARFAGVARFVLFFGVIFVSLLVDGANSVPWFEPWSSGMRFLCNFNMCVKT